MKMKMNILVLMAGAGKRFVDAGYTTPKPLVRAHNGKTILELSTSSLPFISHRGEPTTQHVDYDLTFAIQDSHDVDGSLSQYLRETYGDSIRIVPFEHVTRGAMETALMSLGDFDRNVPLLVLDSDNRYNGEGFLGYVQGISPGRPYTVFCHFEPIDDSEKWCFLGLHNISVVKEISEKKKIPDGKPIMGVYYYNHTELFAEWAQKTLDAGKTVNGEYYMSLVAKTIQEARDNDRYCQFIEPIGSFSCLVDEVIPLGTPEDFEAYNSQLAIEEENE